MIQLNCSNINSLNSQVGLFGTINIGYPSSASNNNGNSNCEAIETFKKQTNSK